MATARVPAKARTLAKSSSPRKPNKRERKALVKVWIYWKLDNARAAGDLPQVLNTELEEELQRAFERIPAHIADLSISELIERFAELGRMDV